MNLQFVCAISCFLVFVFASVLVPENKKDVEIPGTKKGAAKDRDDCEWC
jgi:hypothetical protein